MYGGREVDKKIIPHCLGLLETKEQFCRTGVTNTKLKIAKQKICAQNMFSTKEIMITPTNRCLKKYVSIVEN